MEPVATPPAEVEVVASPEPQPVAASAAEAEEPQASLDDQLQLARELTGERAATATLMDLWGVEHRNCADAEAAGYRCLRQRGSWGNLRQFNRPAILTLVDQRGDTHDVVLTAIDGQQAKLSIGGVTVEHPIGEISRLWLGQYMLLWQPPNGASMSLGPGVSGENVVWLRHSLAAIDTRYRSANPDSDIYDADLEQQVRAFQRDNRLDVDGLAGQQTQIIVTSLLAADNSPRLIQE